MTTAPIEEIIVATTNRGKLAELQRLLGDRGVTVRSLDEFAPLPEAVEDGVTFAENARLKALHYATRLGGWVLADDSGLEVDVLDGAPGVHSARYAGDDSPDRRRRDAANNRKLLAALAARPTGPRTARFRCHLCLVHDAEVVFETSGTVEGVIAAEPAGDNGFGYDPLFYLPDRQRTIAQLPPAQKNAVSHRGAALRKLITFLDHNRQRRASADLHEEHRHGT